MSDIIDRIDMFINEKDQYVLSCKACPYKKTCKEKDLSGNKVPSNCTLPRSAPEHRAGLSKKYIK